MLYELFMSKEFENIYVTSIVSQLELCSYMMFFVVFALWGKCWRCLWSKVVSRSLGGESMKNISLVETAVTGT